MVEKIREEFMYMDAVNYISDVLQKTKGKELKVAFLGGSLSKGERVKRELCFVSLFEQKIEERLSNGRKVSVLRYGQSGTMSSNGLYKVKELIEEKPDLVFLDYAMNDTGDRYLWESTEGICSQLIQAGVHVVILLFCNDQGHCTRGAMERVASHYHLPVVDIGKTITDKIQKGELTWEEYGLDYVHPTPLGHEIITSELLNLFQEKEQKENVMEDYYPETPAFLGAFRNSYIMDLSEKMVDTKPGDVILDTEITMKMMLMEFWQDSIKNEAGLVFMLDGQKVCGADAYASMAWGNPVCHYVGGDGSEETYHLVIYAGKGKPPANWDYSQFHLRLMIGC